MTGNKVKKQPQHFNSERKMNERVNNDPLLTRTEAALYLGLSVKTLACWASTGRYMLTMHKMGSRVKYKKSALDAFITAREV
jgi:excisionase family DNA binding protein